MQAFWGAYIHPASVVVLAADFAFTHGTAQQWGDGKTGWSFEQAGRVAAGHSPGFENGTAVDADAGIGEQV